MCNHCVGVYKVHHEHETKLKRAHELQDKEEMSVYCTAAHNMHTHMHTHVKAHAHTHTHTHARTHTHIHTYIHTYIHTSN